MPLESKLEKAAAIATIVSSLSIIGLIAAFQQLNATYQQLDDSNKQFKAQFDYQRKKDSADKAFALKKYSEDTTSTNADIKRLNHQFYAINQSFLATDLIIVSHPPLTVNMDSKIEDLDFALFILNSGNIALKYTVEKFTITIDGKIVRQLERNIFPRNVLYPKQSTQFGLPPITGSILPSINHLNEKKIICFYTVRYNDIGFKTTKSVSRKYKIVDLGTRWDSTLLSMNDVIN